MFAFAFGIAAVSIVYFTSSLVSKGNNKTLTIVLVGVVVSSLFTSLISLIKYVGDPLDDLPAITFWLMGSLSSAMMADVWPSTIPILVGIIGLIVIKWRINIMSLSERKPCLWVWRPTGKVLGYHMRDACYSRFGFFKRKYRLGRACDTACNEDVRGQ